MQFPNQDLKIKLVLSVAALCLFSEVSRGAILSWSTNAPTPGVNDIYNFAGVTADANNINGGNDDGTYIAGNRVQVGQTFTTGTNVSGYWLNAVTLQQVQYTSDTTFWSVDSGWGAGNPFTVRIGTITGGNFTATATETAPMAASGIAALDAGGGHSGQGTGAFFKMTLASPVLLSPSTTYAFSVDTANPYLEVNGNGTIDTNYAGGQAFSIAHNASGGAATTYTGDRVFVLSLTTATNAPVDISALTIDPSFGLTNYTGLGEWDTSGNFESWTTSGVSGAVVSGGSLSGTGSAASAQLSKLSFANGPDLDLGYNDFLDLRLQVPAAFTGDVRIYYGTTNTTGISSSRMLTIPNSVIVKDGAMHVYRFSLGLEVYWRGNLTDARIELTGASGAAFAVDYLRVGDEPNPTVYSPRYTTECPAAGGTTPTGALFGPGQTVYSMESKHFRYLWNDALAAHGAWTTNMPHGTLRNAEECWQVYVKKLGYREPAYNIGTTNGTAYKLNITSWYSGYWAGGDAYNGTSLARLNITPDGLRVDPPTWVIPHELMHCFQFHNSSGNVPGEWFEFHANYGRERWLQHMQVIFPNTSGIDPLYLRFAHELIGEGRDYYLSWPLFLYLDENPDGLPDLGEGTLVKLWQQTQPGEYPLMALERLTPTSSLKDIVGGFARREATFNYASQTAIQSALAGDSATTTRWQFTDLVQRSDDPTWWRVPIEMAPMQGAYAIHELVPTGSGAGRVVTVNFHGLPDSARGADWRASFIVIADNGTERYSTLWGNGSNSVTLATNENKVYLSVAGAPAMFYTGGFDEPTYPFRTYPSKSRFPYEMQVTGATPRQRDNGSTAGLVQHSNGGGYKAATATVASTVYLGPNARVLNTANVSGNARIEDYAVVSDSAVVSNSAIISGHAWVRGNAVVSGNAKVRDWALVEGGAVLADARVLEHANISGGTVTDTATAKGSATSSYGTLVGNSIIDGDCGGGRDVTNSIAFGFLPYTGVPDSYLNPLPTGLYAAYDFATAHDSRILDQYGVTDGFSQGSPTWYASDGSRAGFLAFNGMNQFVTLDRSVSDLRQITVAAWVKWSGGSGNQPVWYLGTASTNCMYVTPDDGTGHAAFSMTRAGATQTLTWANSLPVGAWAHVAVALDGTNAVFYVNGTLASTAAITNRADQLLAPNSATNLQQNYLARGAGSSLPYFQGAVDDVQFYSAALPSNSIAALAQMKLAGTVIGSSGAYGGSGNTITNVFDNNLATYYDAVNASGDWAGLDLGTAQVITQIKYCPRPTFASRMVGGVFQGANVANFSSGVVTLFTVSAAPSDGVLTSQTITNSGSYRYVRYLGPANSYCNVAEIQFYKVGGPSISPAAGSITFAAISNVTLNAGVTLNVTNSATDPNQPPLPLTFSILSGPTGATIGASSGLLTWRPAIAQANTTNPITLKVQNAATPGLSATQSFTAKINAIIAPGVTNARMTNGVFGFQVSGGVGPDYFIQASTNLFDWTLVYSNTPAALPFSWTDTNLFNIPARFYRVRLGP